MNVSFASNCNSELKNRFHHTTTFFCLQTSVKLSQVLTTAKYHQIAAKEHLSFVFFHPRVNTHWLYEFFSRGSENIEKKILVIWRESIKQYNGTICEQ